MRLHHLTTKMVTIKHTTGIHEKIREPTVTERYCKKPYPWNDSKDDRKPDRVQVLCVCMVLIYKGTSPLTDRPTDW